MDLKREIQTILDQVFPHRDEEITTASLEFINALLNETKEKLQRAAKAASQIDNRTNIVKQVLPEALAVHALNEAEKVLSHTSEFFTFPPIPLCLHCQQDGNDGLFFAAVLEFLCAEILQLSGNLTRQSGSNRITRIVVDLAIRKDPLVFSLYCDSALFSSSATLLDVKESEKLLISLNGLSVTLSRLVEEQDRVSLLLQNNSMLSRFDQELGQLQLQVEACQASQHELLSHLQNGIESNNNNNNNEKRDLYKN